MDRIDLYCERVGSEFWAEPLNALSNASFLISALCAWYVQPRSAGLRPGPRLLIGLAVVIGLGSFAFHTAATRWAQALDVLPILVFQLVFLWHYGRHVIGIGVAASSLTLAVFLGACLLGREFPEILNGSLSYAPALFAVLALGLYHALHRLNAKYTLLIAAGIFALSLLWRTVDRDLCEAWPQGTHFLWHLANGVVIYLVIRTLARQPFERALARPHSKVGCAPPG